MPAMFGQFGIVSPIHKDKTKRPHGSSVQPKPGFGISNFGISIGAEIFFSETENYYLEKIFQALNVVHFSPFLGGYKFRKVRKITQIFKNN